MWYNGCYTMTYYIQGNQKVYTKNPLYWDTDCTLFDTVTVKMVESGDIGFQLYRKRRGRLCWSGRSADQHHCKRTRSNPLYNYWYRMLRQNTFLSSSSFNYNKLKDDGSDRMKTGIQQSANDSFRKVLVVRSGFEQYYKRFNAINPMVCENNFYTMKGLVYTSDGTDYVELVRQEMGLQKANGKTPARLEQGKSSHVQEAGNRRADRSGRYLPGSAIDYFILASSQTALDSANVLKQVFSDSLGDDFIQLNIKTYALRACSKEVIQAHRHSFVNNGWGADYGDPQNYPGSGSGTAMTTLTTPPLTPMSTTYRRNP